MENHGTAEINFDCFAIDESNQVKISREIMRCQGYFFKIDLGTRLRLPLLACLQTEEFPAVFREANSYNFSLSALTQQNCH